MTDLDVSSELATGLVTLGLIFVALLGLGVGSFLNVVVWRVPRRESVVRPASACPQCGERIRARDNVPVLSWLLLRGRCRDCGARISVRYPLVELGTAVAFVLVTWLVGLTWALPAHLFLVAITVALALIDVDHHRLPDAIVLPSYPVALALIALASGAPGTEFAHGDALIRALIAGAAMFVVYFLLLVVYPRGMGFGDVKLAGVLGLYLGWWGWGAVVVGWFSAFLLGGLFSLALIAMRRAGRKSKVPFGPWMLLGAWVGIVAGQVIWEGYLALVGL